MAQARSSVLTLAVLRSSSLMLAAVELSPRRASPVARARHVALGVAHAAQGSAASVGGVRSCARFEKPGRLPELERDSEARDWTPVPAQHVQWGGRSAARGGTPALAPAAGSRGSRGAGRSVERPDDEGGVVRPGGESDPVCCHLDASHSRTVLARGGDVVMGGGECRAPDRPVRDGGWYRDGRKGEGARPVWLEGLPAVQQGTTRLQHSQQLILVGNYRHEDGRVGSRPSAGGRRAAAPRAAQLPRAEGPDAFRRGKHAGRRAVASAARPAAGVGPVEEL
eukprot:scaffold7703_cov103-Isochrysis_galbana.AAC.9